MMAAAIHILYVDDEPSLLDIGKMFLEKSGEFTVTTELSALEAIRLLEQEKFDAIISDYQMPGMDGIQFLVEVRSRFGQIPFILFTGRGREEVVIQAINSGADFYLQKGGEPKSQFAELSHKIMSAASRRRAEDALRESEKKYHNVIEDQTEFISRFLPDGMHIFVNDAYCRYFGVAREDILGRRFMPVLYEEDRQAVAAFFATLTLKNPVGTIDQRTIMPDGSTRWQRWSDRAIFDADGKLVEYQSVGRDITGQKEAEIAIKKSDAQLNAIIQSSPIPKFVIDKDHRVIHWNKALEAYSGIKEKEIIGTNQHWRAFYKEERPCMADLILDGAVEKLSQWYSGKYAKSKLIEGAYEATDFFPHMGITGTWLFFTASVIKDDDGNIMGAIETLEDSTETHLKTEELNIAYQKIQTAFDLVKESEEQYRNIVEDQTEFISRFLPDGTHIFVNDAYCRYFGLVREDILGNRFRPVIHSDNREAVAGFFATLTLKNPVGIIDQRTIMPDGSTRWQRWSDRAIFDADGKVVQYQSVGRDITEYKQAEEALKESEEQLHLAIDGANLGLWDMNLLNGEMVHNQRWAEMLGFSMDELKKPSEWWGQRVHPEDYQNVSNLSNLHRAGKVPFFDAVYRMKHKNGEWRWVHSAGKIISRDSNGAALRLIGVNQDITGQKTAEQDILRKNEELEASYEELTATGDELQQTINDLQLSEQKLSESEEKYRTVFENTGTATVVLEENGIISLANEEFVQLCGFSKDAIEGKKSWTEFVVKEDLERMRVQHQLRRQDETKALTHYEFRFVTKSGDTRNIYLSIGVIPQTKKSVASLLDITDRKRAEELYQTIFENTGTAMIILEEDTTISYVNGEMEKIWGYSKEEIEGRVKWPTLVAAEDLQKMLEYHRLRRSDPDSAPRNYEFRFVHKNGGLLDAALTASMIPGTKKSVISLRDITEIKTIERALRESGERLNFAIESAHLGLWDLDFVTYEVVHNRQWTEMLGFSSAEIKKPSSWWQERVHPDDSALVSKSNEDHIAGRAPYFDCIYRMQHKNGSWRWLHSQGKVISRDNDGRPLRMIGINQDITERKVAEEKLNEREEKYRTIFENAGDAIAIHDLNGHFIEVNDIICKRLGYSREELLTMTVGDVDDPAHARNVEDRIRELSKNGHVVFETVHIARDGRKIPTEASAVIFHIGDKPFILSIARDITERKRAEEALLKNAEELHASYEELTASEEELRQNIDDLSRSEQALRENEEKFRVLSEQSILGIGIIQDGIFQYFNSGYCAISGYSEDEIRRWKPYEYAKTVHPDDLDFVTEQIQKKQMNSPDAVTHYSFRALNKEGKVLVLDLYSRTVMYHGRPADFVMFIDITGRKVAEESLQQANKKLTLLSSLTRHDIKNQLTVLLGYLDILEQKQSDPTLTEYFQKLTTATNRISSLIQFTKEYEKVGINAPMWQDTRNLIETAAKQAPLGQVMVKNVFPAGAEIFADPLVVKVVYNLMDNAVRYGGKITTIRFSVEERKGGHVVVCEDDGDGVVAEEKEKIFNRGFGKNTGLGLALSKEILSITGITIKETGEPGKGARFEMNVPKGAWRIIGKDDR